MDECGLLCCQNILRDKAGVKSKADQIGTYNPNYPSLKSFKWFEKLNKNISI